MKSNITLGRYLPGNSFIHRLNPKIKIISLLILLGILFTLRDIFSLIVLLIAGLSLFFMAKIPIMHVIKSLKPIIYIVLISLIVFFFFTKGGVVLVRVGSFTVESEGVWQGVFVVIRLLNLLLFSLLVTLSTTPLSLTHGFSYYLKPLKKVGLPVDEISMIMAITLRFIPTLIEEGQRLIMSQSARGVDFETGSLIKKVRNLSPLIVPLFVSSFRRADELATAMEARGFCVGAERTRMHQDYLSWQDWIIPLILGFLLIISLIIKL